ncbi:MAG: envelope biogenesis factor ElyC [Deltaproteobacteria bacterium]|jgi:uncharacterized SAM-binding protein YcdF (DUF218 family)
MDTFLAKKIITSLLMPLSFSLLLAFLGLVFLAYSHRQRLGGLLTTGGLLLLWAFSIAPVANWLLAPFVNCYPPLDPAKVPAVQYIVVLGSGNTSDKRLPPTSQIDGAALARLTEAIRIKRCLPGTRLLLSGGKIFDPVPNAEIMARTAKALGVPAKDILLETKSLDTEEEARLIKKIISDRPFVLVTSASHLPRAMALFKHLGMAPIPAPAQFPVKKSRTTNPGDFFPSAANLAKSERAVYEYLGLGWAKLNGQI